jgi:hypothetical protein
MATRGCNRSHAKGSVIPDGGLSGGYVLQIDLGNSQAVVVVEGVKRLRPGNDRCRLLCGRERAGDSTLAGRPLGQPP